MTRAQRSRLRAIILALTFWASSGIAAGQSVPLISAPFSLSAAGSGPVITLNGQSSCSIALSNAGSGLTLVPQASSDNGASWATVSAIGGGSISTFGTYTGSVGGTGLTSFRFLITALSSGTVSGNEVCSGAIGVPGGGGATDAVNVTQINGTSVGSPTAAGVSQTGNIIGIQGVTGGLAVPISGAVTGSGNFTVVQPTGTNLHAVLDTTSTTAVTQATASNLNAAVVGIGVAGTPAGGVVSMQGVAGGTAVPVSGTFYQATQPTSCTAANCTTEIADSGGTNKLAVNSNGSINSILYNSSAVGIQTLADGTLRVAQGKTATILTSASATTCTNIQATAGNLVELVNAGAATTVFPAFYNDAGATCATGTRVYGNFTSLTLQAGQAIQLNIPLSAGLAYKLSGALSDNLIVVTD